MTTRLSFDHTPKLLAIRHSGTVDVALFWSKRRHRAAVCVEDEATGEHFELPVEPGENALEVYEHRYAYAGRRNRPRPVRV